MNQFQRNSAFTLAEVLITLGIIGIVAALTLPSVIQKYREKQLVTAYLRIYSILNQAYTFAIPEHGTFDSWEKSAVDTYNKLKPYLVISVDCPAGKSNKKCIYQDYYKNLDNSQNDTDYSHSYYDTYPAIRLISGESIVFYDSSAVDFFVDLNGNKGPNKFGEDAHFLSFNTMSNYQQILPGARWSNNIDDSPQGGKNQCRRAYNWFPGATCGYWILKHHNMDYLHLSDEEIQKRW